MCGGMLVYMCARAWWKARGTGVAGGEAAVKGGWAMAWRVTDPRKRTDARRGMKGDGQTRGACSSGGVAHAPAPARAPRRQLRALDGRLGKATSPSAAALRRVIESGAQSAGRPVLVKRAGRPVLVKREGPGRPAFD